MDLSFLNSKRFLEKKMRIFGFGVRLTPAGCQGNHAGVAVQVHGFFSEAWIYPSMQLVIKKHIKIRRPSV